MDAHFYMFESNSIRPVSHGDHHDHYDAAYAEKYILDTIGAPYTRYKNSLLARVIADMEYGHVVDIGSNVSAILRLPGSLRFQLEQYGITYTGVDVIEEYFNPESAKNLGIHDEHIYDSIDHRLASAEKLPFQDNSLDAVVCADVIEHVDHPDQAFNEMARVLKPEGRALVIVPSMYKLDLFDFDYIENKRKSSHESKLNGNEWQNLWEDAGMEMDVVESRPLGIASGLSYLSWLDEDVVPERHSLKDEQKLSENARIQREMKKLLATHDEAIDLIIFEKGLATAFITLLKNGDVHGVFALLKNILLEDIHLEERERGICESFFTMTAKAEYPEVYIQKIRDTFGSAEHPELLLGNSTLVVLKHKEHILRNDVRDDAVS